MCKGENSTKNKKNSYGKRKLWHSLLHLQIDTFQNLHSVYIVGPFFLRMHLPFLRRVSYFLVCIGLCFQCTRLIFLRNCRSKRTILTDRASPSSTIPRTQKKMFSGWWTKKMRPFTFCAKFWQTRHRPVYAAGLFFLHKGLFSLRFGRFFNMYQSLFLMHLSHVAQRFYRKGISLVHHLENKKGETTQFVLCKMYIYI